MYARAVLSHMRLRRASTAIYSSASRMKKKKKPKKNGAHSTLRSYGVTDAPLSSAISAMYTMLSDVNGREESAPIILEVVFSVLA